MFELRKLSVNDGMDIYEMLQDIPAEENNMHNSANGISFEAYKEFLVESEKESRRDGIIDGWKVPSTRYWLYVDGKPVGFAILRHFLTPALRQARRNGAQVNTCTPKFISLPFLFLNAYISTDTTSDKKQ